MSHSKSSTYVKHFIKRRRKISPWFFFYHRETRWHSERSREVRGILIVQGRPESENISSESIQRRPSRNSAPTVVRVRIFTKEGVAKGRDGNSGSFAGMKDQRPERTGSSLRRVCVSPDVYARPPKEVFKIVNWFPRVCCKDILWDILFWME